MGYGYFDYYTTPIMSYVDYSAVLLVTILIAIVIGVVLLATFLRKNNEGKYTGFKEKLYNTLVFNRFYTEKIIKCVYIIAACVVTAVGIVLIVLGSFMAGIVMLVVVNIGLRISAELILMFIILCKKTVSVDRRLSKIERFYYDNYDDEWGFDCGDDEEIHEGCGDDCRCDEEIHEGCGDDCRGDEDTELSCEQDCPSDEGCESASKGCQPRNEDCQPGNEDCQSCDEGYQPERFDREGCIGCESYKTCAGDQEE